LADLNVVDLPRATLSPEDDIATISFTWINCASGLLTRTKRTLHASGVSDGVGLGVALGEIDGDRDLLAASDCVPLKEPPKVIERDREGDVEALTEPERERLGDTERDNATLGDADVEASRLRETEVDADTETVLAELAPYETDGERDAVREDDTEGDATTDGLTERDAETERLNDRDAEKDEVNERDAARDGLTERDAATDADTDAERETVGQDSADMAYVWLSAAVSVKLASTLLLASSACSTWPIMRFCAASTRL
jgi:hypothetical protein